MPESLCFLIAKSRLTADPPISEEEWIWHMVQHMRGDRHVMDGKADPITVMADPVGLSVKEMSVSDEYEPLNESETQLYEKLLVDTLHGDIEAVKANFDAVTALRSPHLNPLRSVAAFAAFKGHMAIVQFALDRGVTQDRVFCLSVQRGCDKSAEMGAYYEANKQEFDEKSELPRDPTKGWKGPFEWLNAWITE